MAPGSIPGQGTKIPQAMWCGQKKKKNCQIILNKQINTVQVKHTCTLGLLNLLSLCSLVHLVCICCQNRSHVELWPLLCSYISPACNVPSPCPFTLLPPSSCRLTTLNTQHLLCSCRLALIVDCPLLMYTCAYLPTTLLSPQGQELGSMTT